VAVIGQVLVQFVFRLTFGMALAMGITSPRLVSSGYYRVHLWVLMGINTLGTLAVYSGQASAATWASWQVLCGWAVALAAASYTGAVLWLYEAAQAGRVVLYALAAAGLCAAVLALPAADTAGADTAILALLDVFSGGLLLGATMAAMLLGHWYLNTPTMQLAPLRRLINVMTMAAILRGAVCALGLGLHLPIIGAPPYLFVAFLAFRWLTGIIGAALLARMAAQTLKIPNTQSATGLLYAAVIFVFLGELVSQLLSVDALYPL
jgi:hypothetical protein